MYNAQDLPSQLLGEIVVYFIVKICKQLNIKKSLFGRKGVTESIFNNRFNI